MIIAKAVGKFVQTLVHERRKLRRESTVKKVGKKVTFGEDTEITPLIAVESISGDENDDLVLSQLDSNRSLSAEYYSYENSTGAIGLCALLFLVYLLLGVAAFSFIFEKWPIIYSAYYSVVTFTTIGFGDLTPSSDAGKIFTIFFTLFGVCILGFLFGIIGHYIFEAQKEARREAKVRAQRRVSHMFSLGEHEIDQVHPPPGYGSDDYGVRKGKPLREDIREIICLEAPMIALIIIVTILIGQIEGWSIVDSFYYCVISLTTVGYGDVHPDTKVSMFVNVFFLPLSVAILGEVLARIAGAYIDRKIRQKEEEFLHRELTLSDLEAMDENLDDKVELWEFLSFMLVAMQKVDKRSIDELKTIFHELDSNGNGALEKSDLIILAKRKRERVLGHSSSRSARSLRARSHTH